MHTGTASRMSTNRCAADLRWIHGGLCPPQKADRRMTGYILRRLLLVLPTLFGIIAINFAVVQLAPGGPVEQVIAELKGRGGGGPMGRLTGGGAEVAQSTSLAGRYRGDAGLDPHLLQDIKGMFGFDKPPLTRFWLMLKGYLQFDFGQSFFRGQSVLHLVMTRLPVSISLGLWSTLLVYLVSIPLGIAKATREGTRFDVVTSMVVLIGYAIPGFLFAVLLAVLFAGGSFVQWFPLRGLTSEGAENWSFVSRVLDYGWHMVLPTIALVVGGFASLTLLTRNCFIEEIRKQYVLTARAKGASENRVLYGHVFRNAMLLIVSGFPAAFVSILFSSALLIEIVFSLDGLGLLGFDAAIRRDYPVMFGTLYIFTLIGLLMQIVGDLMYTAVDPRIDFEGRS
ncbi:Oligopeptide transport system permease protein oppB [Granulibacter bethesdensis]|uniref:Oligopeptide transport system permease protein oppB n=2 Tax=Granulibacter bethesdensis TaxID=364410 RepID=A0AAC9P975_9PROT|nr:Oligopeptide transport system permease protein oppB [Granulibacter bethesdensis]APH62894.1 Oligopeptide transport system permease protein oppB [Granulibacter bethesdensis]